ncbi:MAG TPA: CvpA family protein [Dehalococcoidia bacterium]|nr:CvpA family protein [Dehalococcoidia bacterium]
MTWPDIAILVVLGWFVVTSMLAGLLREVLSLIGLIVGVVLGGRYYAAIAEQWGLFERFGDVLGGITAFAGIFLAITVAAHVVAAVLQRIVGLLFLGWLDKLGGAAFGLAKGILIVEIALVLLLRLPSDEVQQTLRASLLAPALLKYAPVVFGLLPADFDAARDLLAT